MHVQENYPAKKHLQLIKAILKLKNSKEATKFLRDLLTIAEIEEISTRLELARLLDQGKLTYLQIAQQCQVSTTTVTRTAHWLHQGMGGYKIILKKLK